MTEQEYKNYFQNLATQHKEILHGKDKKKSFFYVDNPFDWDEVDEAINNKLQPPFMLLDTPEGVLDDNGTNNYVDTINGSFSIIGKAKTQEEVALLREKCKRIGIDILARVRTDGKKTGGKGGIVPGKLVNFNIADIPYTPLAPPSLPQHFHGWLFTFQFACPFSYTVDSSIWADLDTGDGTEPNFFEPQFEIQFE
jgi:hypothetical protein